MSNPNLKSLKQRLTKEQLEKRRERIKHRKMQKIITQNIRVKKGSALT